jgi:ribonuclease P protein component
MLSKIYRIKKENEFKKIYRFGLKQKASFFIIRYLENNLSYSRFGIVIPAKAIKKAVKRNFFRRQIIETIRLKSDTIKTGYDVVFSLFKAPEVEKEKIKEEILNTFQKAKLLND